jgi:PRTRC genetic system protein A
MSRPFVDYLVTRDGRPRQSGLVYDYILAGDGLWLAAANDSLAVRVPVALAEVRGLPVIGPACELRHGPLPAAIWDGCVRVARGATRHGLEVLLLVIHGAGGYRLELPRQRVTPARVHYDPPELAGGEAIVLQLHSHHAMGAFFSATDNADEQGLGLYGVVGRVGGDRPEVVLRAGAYGHWLPVPWSAVFAGDPGAFRDIASDSPRAASPRADDGTRDAPPDPGDRPLNGAPDAPPADDRVGARSPIRQVVRWDR